MSVIEQLRPVIADELAVAEDEVQATAHLMDDLDADSMNLMVIYAQVEQLFGVKIDDAMSLRINTVGDLLKAIGPQG